MQQQQQQLPKNKNMDNGNLKNNSNTKIESMKKQQNNYNHHTHQHQHHQTNHNHHHHLHPHSHQNQHHHLSPHPPTHNHISTQRRGYSSQQDLTSDDGDMYQWKKRTTVVTHTSEGAITKATPPHPHTHTPSFFSLFWKNKGDTLRFILTMLQKPKLFWSEGISIIAPW